MEARIRENYQYKDSEELLALRASNDLTDVARRILDEELAARQIAPGEIAAGTQLYADLASVQQEGQAALASIPARFMAKLIDVWGVALIGFGINFLLALMLPLAAADVLFTATVVLFVAYLFAKDGIAGRSLGKRAMGIMVVDADTGKPCSVPKSILRNVLGFFLGFIDALFALGAKRQRLGDMAANTRVINK
ncbi:hypothetical protein IGB42_01775 [Andreprevotia sp. IGB-42]|nr:hypothetical protein IGB42_01775 [Andreprevotia sp. IGB-42]